MIVVCFCLVPHTGTIFDQCNVDKKCVHSPLLFSPYLVFSAFKWKQGLSYPHLDYRFHVGCIVVRSSSWLILCSDGDTVVTNWLVWCYLHSSILDSVWPGSLEMDHPAGFQSVICPCVFLEVVILHIIFVRYSVLYRFCLLLLFRCGLLDSSLLNKEFAKKKERACKDHIDHIRAATYFTALKYGVLCMFYIIRCMGMCLICPS